MMYYTLDDDGNIKESADWKFPGSTATTKNIVRHTNGRLYFEDQVPPVDPTLEKKARLTEIENQLTALDLQTIRALRATLAGVGTGSDQAKLISLESDAEVLRAEHQQIRAELVEMEKAE